MQLFLLDDKFLQPTLSLFQLFSRHLHLNLHLQPKPHLKEKVNLQSKLNIQATLPVKENFLLQAKPISKERLHHQDTNHRVHEKLYNLHSNLHHVNHDPPHQNNHHRILLHRRHSLFIVCSLFILVIMSFFNSTIVIRNLQCAFSSCGTNSIFPYNSTTFKFPVC